jgi:mRNA interferase ChpB
MQRGEIYIVSLDPASGHEQRGDRRVLIVTEANFNKATGAPVVLPITTGGTFARTQGFAVRLSGLSLTTDGIVRCDQPRVLDLAARGARKLNERVPAAVMDDILARLGTLFD